MQFRIYDKTEMKYRNDITIDTEGSLLFQGCISGENRTETLFKGTFEHRYIVERGFRGIFEGDIIKTNRGDRTGPVDFDKYKGVFDRKNGIFTERLHDLFDNKRKVEVIGNIHDK